jgi:hypothetical protein
MSGSHQAQQLKAVRQRTRSRQKIVRLRQARSKEASLAGEQSACRSQIKHRYGSHRQQPQNDSRNDELDP